MKKIKILCDISFTAFGQAGIMSDLRNTLEALLKIPNCEVDFIIYSIRNDLEILNFRNTEPNDLGSQAQLISELTGTKTDRNPKFFAIKLIYKLISFFKAVTLRDVKKIKVNKNLKESIYRYFLLNWLGANFIENIDKTNIFILPFSLNVFKYKVHLGMNSKIKIDTSNYDFVIFQTEILFEVSKNTVKIIRHHDLIPLLMPDTEIDAYHRAKYTQHSTQVCIDQNSIFVCNSAKTQFELHSNFNLDAIKSTIINCAVSNTFRRKIDPIYLKQILEARISTRLMFADSLGSIKARGTDLVNAENKIDNFIHNFNPTVDKFFLMVGLIDTRKNIKVLIKAYDLIISRYISSNPESSLYIFVAGNLGNLDPETLRLVEAKSKKLRLIYLEKPSIDELSVLYSHAIALIFPSLNEGFGIPPIEAMLCKTPVITSDISVHREIQGEHSVYFNPYSHRDLASKINEVLYENRINQVQLEKANEFASNYLDSKICNDWTKFFNSFDL
jgi:glycosyltransferase involved in cell wall biosynthesis